MTAGPARVLTLPVPSRPAGLDDPWCTCEHRQSGHLVTRSGTATSCANGRGRGQCPCKRFVAVRPISRDEFAAGLVPCATRLVEIVHGAGGRVDVAAVLAAVARLRRPDDVDPLAALAVVLAALVPADVDPARALSWITWDWEEAE